MFEHILLVADDSAACQRAVEVTASLARSYQAQVSVLNVVTPVSGLLGEPNFDEAASKAVAESRQIVEAPARRLRELGVARTDSDSIGGAAAEVILTVAETRQIDLIVLGAHDSSRPQFFRRGSVDGTVLQRSECPVLVVK